MNWEAFGAIAEGLGAIGVIVTLIYVAVQLRQNTAALRSTATQGAHDQSSKVYDLLAGDADLGLIWARGLREPDSLNPAETARFFAILQATMFRLQNWYFQTESGLIDPQLLESWTRVVQQACAMPGFKVFWEQRQIVYAPEFKDYLAKRVFTEDSDPGFRPLGVGAPSAGV